MTYKKFNELKQGDQFRFLSDPLGVIRTASQIGRTEIYCPRNGENTMGHCKGDGQEVYLKSDKLVIMVLTEVRVNFKNLPPEVAGMIEVAFEDVLNHIGETPLKMPEDGLTIDFNDATDPNLMADLMESVRVFIMAHSFAIINKRENEKSGN